MNCYHWFIQKKFRNMFFKTILFVAVVQSVLSLKRIPPVPQTAARARFTINAAGANLR